ncbi:DMT family transporter [Chitinibacter bivalviorum]|uniref:DMT family transporter n=1 Tax=Chitinibacter bivalviorum TaxID=2739434 RepID=A0A7H9BEE2_9NEIS|nr:DMT family transporter [Chitinibacter bivalviorum]QLG86989.1 DMT family transporter [Chitinibacter bivalviorum]
MQTVYTLLALFIGLVVPLQAAVNNQLRAFIGGSPLLAALVSFSVGIVTLLLMSLATGQKMSGLMGLAKVQPWMLVGGVLGAIFVFGTTLIAPKLGAASMLALIIGGQVCAGLLFDRFGWLGMPLRDLSWPRLLGAALVIMGVLLVNFGDRLLGSSS